ncbi:ArsR/SmtB family transcription factor [Deinococcus sedimenti]|uniref:HTH arsR-type domain-containing protein n=1 Tax=Deinococcus sedimenti TaxID=1867090 RepID=A0ABQ2S769_9DEIO|nr:metalloregulator ArsR/SmtB family transcription factor [Deinococcus sedimenti]GGR95061.1 hypothetical protein GCM10008960_22510 [Deinococcus sedimenti]
MDVPDVSPFDLLLTRLRALGDPTRLRIVQLIGEASQKNEQARDSGEHPAPVSISATLGLTQPTISHHMKVLLEAGLVTSEKKGTKVYYSLNPDGFRDLTTFFEPLAQPCKDD